MRYFCRKREGKNFYQNQMLIVCPFRKSQKQKSCSVFCLQAGRDRVDSNKMSSYIFCLHFCHSCVSLMFGWVTMNQTPVWEEKACAAAFFFISLGLFFFFLKNSWWRLRNIVYSDRSSPMDLSVMPNCRVVQMKELSSYWKCQMFTDVLGTLRWYNAFTRWSKYLPKPLKYTDSKVKPLFWSVRFLCGPYRQHIVQMHRFTGRTASDYHSAAFTVPVNISDNWEDFFCVLLRALNPFNPREFFSATSLSWWTLSCFGFCWS